MLDYLIEANIDGTSEENIMVVYHTVIVTFVPALRGGPLVQLNVSSITHHPSFVQCFNASRVNKSLPSFPSHIHAVHAPVHPYVRLVVAKRCTSPFGIYGRQ